MEEAGHAPLHAAAMALSLLPDANVPAQVRQQVRPYRHLTMTPHERDTFARSLLSRRVLAEGMLLSLEGNDVRDGAVLSAHKLCESVTAKRPMQLQIGGSRATKDQIREASARLRGEIGDLDVLIEAATKQTGTDLKIGTAGAKANPRVVHLQNRLNTLGHRVLPDGVFGPMTDEAVKDFQTNAGLPANGVVDSLTADSLRRGGSVQVDAPPGMVPGQQVPQTGQDDGTNRETGNSAQQNAPAEKQPAEGSSGAGTASRERSDAKKADSTTKAGGKSVSVNVKLNESIGPIKKGAFHAWLGKDPDEDITDADIAKGLASKDPHARKMANFAKSAKKWHHGKKVQEGALEEAAFAPVYHYTDATGKKLHFKAPNTMVAHRAAAQRGKLPLAYHGFRHRAEGGGGLSRSKDERITINHPDLREVHEHVKRAQAKLGDKKVQEGVCECGAPDNGHGVCQRGHRLDEAWSEKAREAAAAARRSKGTGVRKNYYVMQNVGKARHVINFHNGVSTHDDGSPFYDMHIANNKPDRDKFVADLRKSGYVERDEADMKDYEAQQHDFANAGGSGSGGHAKSVKLPNPSMHTASGGSDYEAQQYRAANPPEVPFGSHSFPKSGAGMQSMGGGKLPTQHMYGPHKHVIEADGKSDFPQGQLCPECGAKMLKSGVCQRGHRVKKLMEATFEQMREDGLL